MPPRALLLPLCVLALPAAAQDPPACTPPREGVVACIAGRLCACRHERGGSLTGRPDGHRWDCSALRPACGEGLAPPGIATPFPMPLPDLLLMPPPPRGVPFR